MRNADVHAQVLRRYDIGNVTSAKDAWWQNGETFALLLEEAASGEPLGAVRLQRWGNGIPLPIESALAGVDPGVSAWVERFAGDGVGELCGLWCSPCLRGFGLGAVLTRMGLSLATKLETRTVLGLCDTRSVMQNVGYGFERDDTVAMGGRFEYPRPGLFAHVLRVTDAARLEGATRSNRLAIEAYRRSPVGHEVLETDGRRLVLERHLALTPERAAALRRTPGPSPSLPAHFGFGSGAA
jgi:hypothetical protein